MPIFTLALPTTPWPPEDRHASNFLGNSWVKSGWSRGRPSNRQNRSVAGFPEGSNRKATRIWLSGQRTSLGSTRRRPPTGACGFLPRRRIARNEVHGRSLKRVTEFMTGTTFRVNGDATRAEFLSGWAAIVQFLARKWAREPDYRLIKEPVKWEVAPECRLSGRSPCALLWAP